MTKTEGLSVLLRLLFSPGLSKDSHLQSVWNLCRALRRPSGSSDGVSNRSDAHQQALALAECKQSTALLLQFFRLGLAKDSAKTHGPGILPAALHLCASICISLFLAREPVVHSLALALIDELRSKVRGLLMTPSAAAHAAVFDCLAAIALVEPEALLRTVGVMRRHGDNRFSSSSAGKSSSKSALYGETAASAVAAAAAKTPQLHGAAAVVVDGLDASMRCVIATIVFCAVVLSSASVVVVTNACGGGGAAVSGGGAIALGFDVVSSVVLPAAVLKCIFFSSVRSAALTMQQSLHAKRAGVGGVASPGLTMLTLSLKRHVTTSLRAAASPPTSSEVKESVALLFSTLCHSGDALPFVKTVLQAVKPSTLPHFEGAILVPALQAAPHMVGAWLASPSAESMHAVLRVLPACFVGKSAAARRSVATASTPADCDEEIPAGKSAALQVGHPPVWVAHLHILFRILAIPIEAHTIATLLGDFFASKATRTIAVTEPPRVPGEKPNSVSTSQGSCPSLTPATYDAVSACLASLIAPSWVRGVVQLLTASVSPLANVFGLVITASILRRCEQVLTLIYWLAMPIEQRIATPQAPSAGCLVAALPPGSMPLPIVLALMDTAPDVTQIVPAVIRAHPHNNILVSLAVSVLYSARKMFSPVHATRALRILRVPKGSEPLLYAAHTLSASLHLLAAPGPEPNSDKERSARLLWGLTACQVFTAEPPLAIARSAWLVAARSFRLHPTPFAHQCMRSEAARLWPESLAPKALRKLSRVWLRASQCDGACVRSILSAESQPGVILVLLLACVSKTVAPCACILAMDSWKELGEYITQDPSSQTMPCPVACTFSGVPSGGAELRPNAKSFSRLLPGVTMGWLMQHLMSGCSSYKHTLTTAAVFCLAIWHNWPVVVPSDSHLSRHPLANKRCDDEANLSNFFTRDEFLDIFLPFPGQPRQPPDAPPMSDSLFKKAGSIVSTHFNLCHFDWRFSSSCIHAGFGFLQEIFAPLLLVMVRHRPQMLPSLAPRLLAHYGFSASPFDMAILRVLGGPSGLASYLFSMENAAVLGRICDVFKAHRLHVALSCLETAAWLCPLKTDGHDVLQKCLYPQSHTAATSRKRKASAVESDEGSIIEENSIDTGILHTFFPPAGFRSSDRSAASNAIIPQVALLLLLRGLGCAGDGKEMVTPAISGKMSATCGATSFVISCTALKHPEARQLAAATAVLLEEVMAKEVPTVARREVRSSSGRIAHDDLRRHTKSGTGVAVRSHELSPVFWLLQWVRNSVKKPGKSVRSAIASFAARAIPALLAPQSGNFVVALTPILRLPPLSVGPLDNLFGITGDQTAAFRDIPIPALWPLAHSDLRFAISCLSERVMTESDALRVVKSGTLRQLLALCSLPESQAAMTRRVFGLLSLWVRSSPHAAAVLASNGVLEAAGVQLAAEIEELVTVPLYCKPSSRSVGSSHFGISMSQSFVHASGLLSLMQLFADCYDSLPVLFASPMRYFDSRARASDSTDGAPASTRVLPSKDTAASRSQTCVLRCSQLVHCGVHVSASLSRSVCALAKRLDSLELLDPAVGMLVSSAATAADTLLHIAQVHSSLAAKETNSAATNRSSEGVAVLSASRLILASHPRHDTSAIASMRHIDATLKAWLTAAPSTEISSTSHGADFCLTNTLCHPGSPICAHCVVHFDILVQRADAWQALP